MASTERFFHMAGVRPVISITAAAVTIGAFSLLWRDVYFRASKHGADANQPHAQKEVKRESRVSKNRPAIQIWHPDEGERVDGGLEVDIVAVHGLGSDVDKAWTYIDQQDPENTCNWLKHPEMLRKKVPQARIMAYSYDSRWFADTRTTDLRTCGKELALALRRRREFTPDRPIIFIGHSLGGLVILQAMLATWDDEDKSLLTSTIGFMSLGTPFRGSRFQAVAMFIARLFGWAGSDVGIIQDIGYGDRHLQDEVNRFKNAVRKLDENNQDIKIVHYFTEQRATDYGKKWGIPWLFRDMVVSKPSASLDPFDETGLNVDHVMINKFRPHGDESYDRVSDEIQRRYKDRWKIMEARKETMGKFYGRQVGHFLAPPRNTEFVDRKAVNDLLNKVLPNENNTSCPKHALLGIGGSGKTQVVIDLAHRVHQNDRTCSVLWVRATDLSIFQSEYQRIGVSLAFLGVEDSPEERHKRLHQVRDAIERLPRWLLIVDNADDSNVMNVVKEYLPKSTNGSILFTTTAREWLLDFAQPIFIERLLESEALAIFKRSLRDYEANLLPDVEEDDALKLLRILEYLPIAIKQAASYMTKNHNTPKEYLKIFSDGDHDRSTQQFEKLAKEYSDTIPGNDKENMRRSFIKTWDVSFTRLEVQNPEAKKYLFFMACLSSDDIPSSLLFTEDTQEEDRNNAVVPLLNYSFISKRRHAEKPNEILYSMHGLVRVAARHRLKNSGDLGRLCVTTAVRRLVEWHADADLDNVNEQDKWIRHAKETLSLQLYCSENEQTARLLFLVGDLHSQMERREEAEDSIREGLRLILPEGMKGSVLGLETADLSRDDTKGIQTNARKDDSTEDHRVDELYKGEEEKPRGTVMSGHKREEEEESLREDDEGLEISAQKEDQDDDYEYEKNSQSGLEEEEDTLLGDKVGRLIFRAVAELAEVLVKLEEMEEGQRLLKLTLGLQRRYLPSHDEDISRTMRCLADAYDEDEKYKEALELFEGTIKFVEHPDYEDDHTTELQVLLHGKGRVLRHYATKMMEQSEILHLKDLEWLLQKNPTSHKEIVTSQQNYARVLERQGKLGDCEVQLREAFQRSKDNIDPSSPVTIKALFLIGRCLQVQRRWSEAKRYFKEAEDFWRSTGGDNHPETKSCRAFRKDVEKEERNEKSRLDVKRLEDQERRREQDAQSSSQNDIALQQAMQATGGWFRFFESLSRRG